MSKRFTLFGLLVATAFIAIGIALVDARQKLAIANRQNAILRFDVEMTRQKQLRDLLATDQRRNRPDIADAIAERLSEEQKIGARSWIDKERIQLEEELAQFSRISKVEYDEAIERIRNLDFSYDNSIRKPDVESIVEFVIAHSHIDPRILSLDRYDRDAVKLSTGEVADGWGFEYIARREKGKWIVRYSKGWTAN